MTNESSQVSDANIHSPVDISQYDDDCGVELLIPDPSCLDSLQLIVEPSEGLYRNHQYAPSLNDIVDTHSK